MVYYPSCAEVMLNSRETYIFSVYLTGVTAMYNDPHQEIFDYLDNT